MGPHCTLAIIPVGFLSKLSTSTHANLSLMEGGQRTFQLSPFLASFIGIISTGLMLLIYHFIVRWCNRRHALRAPHGPPFSPGVETMSGLDNSYIQLIPVYKYGTEVPIDAGECAVCLCEFKEGDEVRRLPECLHSFHVPCIDMWFYSHSNCPICRTDMTLSSGPQQAVQLESGRLPNLGG